MTPSGEDYARLRELAERLFDHEAGLDPKAEGTGLFVEPPPERLAAQLPVPEGLSVAGGVIRRGAGGGPERAELLLDTAMDPEQAIEAYRGRAKVAGWFEPYRAGVLGGFLYHAPRAATAVFCRGSRGPALTVRALPNPRGGGPGEGTEVRTRLETDPRRAPCMARHFLPLRPGLPRPMLPALELPRNWRLAPDGVAGAGGGPNPGALGGRPRDGPRRHAAAWTLRVPLRAGRVAAFGSRGGRRPRVGRLDQDGQARQAVGGDAHRGAPAGFDQSA